MEYIIVTGVSGSGKSCAVNALEDIGFFCIDNMPPQLIPKFAELCGDNSEIERAAIVVDIRGGEFFLQLWDNVEDMRSKGMNVKVLFIYADHDVVKRRYKETRRKHPFYDIAGGDIDKAIDAEFDILMPIKERSDYYIDSSFTSTAKIKEIILNMFTEDVSQSLLINCMSFGFKYGVPDEADLVFDVRFLPNPFYIPELKNKTGIDKDVSDYVMNSDISRQFRDKLFDLMDFLVPQYVAEGKSQLVIAFGCTGGRHRSVTFAEIMYEYLKDKNYTVRVMHRDSFK